MIAAEPKPESVLRPALVLMAGRGFAFIATFFIPVVLARTFDPAQFGTYKQLFLIHSTVFYIAQLGMGTSLYYFLPLAPDDAGRYVANSTAFLTIAGLAGMAVIVATGSKLGGWMSNRELAVYLPWIGAYLALTMIAAALEMVLIARGRFPWASASYALSDLARAGSFIVPVLLFRQLDWLLRCAVAMAALRAAVALFYFRWEFRGGFRLDWPLLRRQLAYALPFAAAVMVEIFQGNLPQYLVSYLTNPAEFAVFAVGCLQIPLIDLAASPSSDVMMVRMQENIARGDKSRVLQIWHDTTWKLALLFFPLTVLVIVAARDIILLLYTQKYAASVPIFMAWSLLILTSALQVDGVMRVFAQLRLLLLFNVTRLAIIGSLTVISLRGFHLLGPVLVMVLANVTFKALAMGRMRKLLNTGLGGLLPWRKLGALLTTSVGAAIPVVAIESRLHAFPLIALLVIGPAYLLVYVALVWRFSLLEENERSAIVQWIRKTASRMKPAANYGGL
jgi:O-antigen/teichoic acid export membrane protein